jgi:hypothetical protein
MYLTLLLNLAKEKMSNWTLAKCCNTGVEHLRKFALKQAKNGRTVMEWCREFRQSRNFTSYCGPGKNLNVVRKI